MPNITLPHGTVHYRTAGPADAAGPPALFVHGFLVDSQLWGGVADAAATAGVRSYAPDLPLGSHRHPLADDAEQTPRGVARQIIAFMEALDLTDVTLVGNDTGGAVCQFLLDTDASRIGRLVLTNCDAFEQFPPRVAAQVHRDGQPPVGAGRRRPGDALDPRPSQPRPATARSPRRSIRR